MRACLLPAAGAGATLEVAGLAVAERTRRGLLRAGFTLVEPGSEPRGGDTLFVASDAVIEPDAARALAAVAASGSGSISAQDALESPAALALPADETPGAALAEAGELGALALRLRERGRLHLAATGNAICQRVHTTADAERLERSLLATLARPSDGFFARHLDRKLSTRISPWLVRRAVTPNTITGVATLVGLLGAACLATQGRTAQILGALLFVLSTILDGCDGEVARLSFTSSDLGRRLDLLGDNVVNAGVFLAIGWSSLRAEAGGVTWTLVQATLGGFVLATAAGFAFSRWIDRSGRQAEFHDRYESLASRDFAYVVLLLAIVGRLPWFVWLAAGGSYAFVLLLVAIRLRAGSGAASQPDGHRWA